MCSVTHGHSLVTLWVHVVITVQILAALEICGLALT